MSVLISTTTHSVSLVQAWYDCMSAVASSVSFAHSGAQQLSAKDAATASAVDTTTAPLKAKIVELEAEFAALARLTPRHEV